MKSHNIKNILEERRIDVSENSWEKLAGQLDANDQKKKRKSFYPYAACFALLVGFSVFMMLKTADAIGTETIVETEKEATKIPTQVDSKEKIISLETEKFSIKNNTVVTQEETLKSIESKDITTSATIEKATESEIELLKEVQNTVVVNTKEKSLKEIETVIAEKDVRIDSNAALKASITALSASEKIAITDEEIDQLLKEAEKSIEYLNVQENVDMTTIVSADDLLIEVEYELDRSFKQKVFELIKSNIQKTRTVIADRN